MGLYCARETHLQMYIILKSWRLNQIPEFMQFIKMKFLSVADAAIVASHCCEGGQRRYFGRGHQLHTFCLPLVALLPNITHVTGKGQSILFYKKR